MILLYYINTMNRTILFNQFSKTPIITKESINNIGANFNIDPRTIDSYIYRAVRDKDLIHLKRGHYVLRSTFDEHRTSSDYIFFLANFLLQPSYISLESALQYYGLIPEAVNFEHTSVSLQLPRKFTNKLGTFSYRNITKSLFDGFYYHNATFGFAIAYPHKAVFDYLYYYTKRFSQHMHVDILEELRIDSGDLSDDEKEKLRTLLSKYTNLKIHI